MATVDKEHWRKRLLELIEHLAVPHVEFAEETDIPPSYLSRMLYPPGKIGRKNLGPESMAKITRRYQLSHGWFDKPLGAELPNLAPLSANATEANVANENPQQPAITSVHQLRWPFHLVTYHRLMDLKRGLGHKAGTQAMTDMNKQLEGIVLKWERELLKLKSRPARQ